MISFSIVINTLNRAEQLRKTLASLRRLRYAGQFEVIVVNGPSTDDTSAVIAEWQALIRSGHCPVANLSVSRNIGICMARGDIVAFIDDDAIPEPEWLTHLAAAYTDPQVGAAGGMVCDRSGYTFQYEYATANRLAETNLARSAPSEHLCFPGSYSFPYLQGTNASFRRTALLEVDGFDEEFEYFLDETDLCCRLMDAGYLVKQLANAYVHHEAAPNAVRDRAQLTYASYPVLKNSLYFAIKHGTAYHSLTHILGVDTARVKVQRANVQYLINDGRFEPAALARFDRDQERARETGLRRGLEGRQAGITPQQCSALAGDFLPFITQVDATAHTIVLISRDYPPGHKGGIATFVKNLAESLAAQGQQVHVITESDGSCHVSLKNGVWVHSMTVRHQQRTSAAEARAIPQHIWNWCATALAETRRIATLRTIDVVEAPVWDCEGAALLLHGSWPLVTSLQTTLKFWLQGHPELGNDPQWMHDFGTPMLALERELMRNAHAVRAISHAIRREIENAYAFEFNPARLQVVPLGMHETDDTPAAAAPASPHRLAPPLTVLFVGRLEERKGIDVLLAAIPRLLEAQPQLRFRILGDHTLPQPGSPLTYRDAWLARHRKASWLKQVTFEGWVDDASLQAAYRDCDVFVAPSRFESFGLVFLEAMRMGKPVIGCDAGGMPEVVGAGVNGLLPPPGDSEALAEAILRLVESATLRSAMGQAGRVRFLQHFTAHRMAAASKPLFELAQSQFASTHG
jgi:glycosyltransferase involved in cell wall biosynthesis